MDKDYKDFVENVTSLCARLALFVVDEIEPRNAETLAEDLEDLVEFLSEVLGTARKWRASKEN